MQIYVRASPAQQAAATRSVASMRDQLSGVLGGGGYVNYIDAGMPGWAQWIASQKLNREAPERGIRFQRIVPVVEAVRASAGLAICGLALLAEQIEDGRLSLPFPIAAGAWTSHGFTARFRRDALMRPQVRRFRE